MILPDDHVTTEEVKAWQGLHLLHFQGSSCSQKVRVLLREKGLEWSSHPIDAVNNQHVSAWYLGINPRGVVPVLVHDGVVHVESNDIMEYLDSLPSQVESFFPQNDSERAFAKQNLAQEDSIHMDLRNLTMGFILPHRLAKKSDETLERWEREGKTDPKRALEVKWWRDYARDGIPAEVAQASVDAHRKMFEELDERLATSSWLLGDRISVLDVAWFITTLRLSKAGYPLGQHARLAAWHDRLTRRPAFSKETRDPLVMRLGIPFYALYRKVTRTTLRDVTN